MTLGELFPGNLGRMELTRVALRIKRADLLKMKPEQVIDEDTHKALVAAIAEVRRG